MWDTVQTTSTQSTCRTTCRARRAGTPCTPTSRATTLRLPAHGDAGLGRRRRPRRLSAPRPAPHRRTRGRRCRRGAPIGASRTRAPRRTAATRTGRATNTAADASASTRRAAHSTRTSGTAHTQWCDHATGDAISIASAARHVPSTRSPRRHHAAATTQGGDARADPATASHSHVGGAPSSSRVSAPYADWLCASAGGPTRLASSSRSPQYRPRARRSPRTRRPPSPRTRATARPAAARRPTIRSSTTNTSGVSLTPAATPSSTPDQRRSGRSRSTSTASMSSRLTCPKVRFCHTGSRRERHRRPARATSQPGRPACRAPAGPARPPPPAPPLMRRSRVRPPARPGPGPAAPSPRPRTAGR